MTTQNHSPAHPRPDNLPQLTELEPIDMHGPIEVTVAFHVMAPGLGARRASFIMPAGVIPTRAEIAATMAGMATPDSLRAAGLPDGSGLMTKTEFVAHITTRDTGVAIPMPGNPYFVPVPSEIPRDMLIHAIVGAAHGAQVNLSSEAPLEDLTNDELRDVYAEITIEG